MVNVINGDVTELTTDADDWATIRYIVVKGESGDRSLAGELHVEREGLNHGDFDSRLLHLVDKDLLINEG